MTSNNFKIEKNLIRVGVRDGVVKPRSQTAQQKWLRTCLEWLKIMTWCDLEITLNDLERLKMTWKIDISDNKLTQTDQPTDLPT